MILVDRLGSCPCRIQLILYRQYLSLYIVYSVFSYFYYHISLNTTKITVNATFASSENVRLIS